MESAIWMCNCFYLPEQGVRGCNSLWFQRAVFANMVNRIAARFFSPSWTFWWRCFGFLRLCLGWLVSCLCTHRFLSSCSSYFTLPVFSVSCETEVFLWPSSPPHRKSEGSLFLYKLIEILKKKYVCTRGLHFCFTPSLSQSVAPSRPSQSLLFIQFDWLWRFSVLHQGCL